MAIVADGTKTILYTIRDRDNNLATLTLYAPALAVTEDVVTWATTTGWDLINGMTNGQLVRVTVQQGYYDNAPVQPPEESDVERKGLFSFNVEGGGVSSFRIPSFDNALVIDGTNTINTTAPAVSNFTAAMVDAGLFDLYGMGNFRGSKLISVNNAPRKVHKGSNIG